MIGPEKEQPMEILVVLTTHWVNMEKPLSIIKNDWKLHKKSVIDSEKDQPVEILVLLTIH